jgi:hypothetical protein
MPDAAPVPAFPGLLEEMTIDDVRAFDPEVVMLPLGSTEPHGPHLPLGTDVYQVTRLCRLAVEEANAKEARVLLYPTLPITNNANFRAFPFALRIGIRTLMSVIVDIAKQCWEDDIRKVVIVNGHGGNPATIDAALREIAGMDDMPFVCWTWGIAPEGFVDPSSTPATTPVRARPRACCGFARIWFARTNSPTIPSAACASPGWPRPASCAPGIFTCPSAAAVRRGLLPLRRAKC